MTEPRPRPRAFRLDDASVAFDDRPAAAAPRAEVRTETAPIPDAPEPLDEGEREIEVAQAAGVAKPWRPTLATLLWTGLGGLVSLGLGLWVDGIVEGLWTKARGLGWLGLAFAALFLAGALGLVLREVLALGASAASPSCTRSWRRRMPATTAPGPAPPSRRLIALYEIGPKPPRPARRSPRRWSEIIDGRDLVEIAERALVKPLDAKGPGRRSPPPPSGCRWSRR